MILFCEWKISIDKKNHSQIPWIVNSVGHPATFGPPLRCKSMGPPKSKIQFHSNDLEMVGDH